MTAVTVHVSWGLEAEQLLAGLTGTPPGSVSLTRVCAVCGGPHGKPQVRVPSGWEVSVAHAGDRLLVAAAEVPVGVDVESLGRETGRGFADVVLHPDEDRTDDPVHLVTSWTRKEALLKATGEGLSVDPRDLRVSGPDDAAELLAWDGHPDRVGALRLVDLPAPEGYVAALAVRTTHSLDVRPWRA